MEQFFTLVANVGFPIAVTAFLLVRIENKLDNLLASVENTNSMLYAWLCSDEKKHS